MAHSARASGSQIAARFLRPRVGQAFSLRPLSPPLQLSSVYPCSIARGAAGGPPPDWSEELARRRRERISESSAKQQSAPNEHPDSSKQTQREADESKAFLDGSGPEPGDAAREEIGRGAAEMQLFAYPTSRTFPWATVALLVASGGLTASAALCWHCYVCRAETVEDLRARVNFFSRAVAACGISGNDLANGEAHRLLLSSLLRAGEQPTRTIADAVVLVCCGTLLERLYGTPFVLALLVGSTMVSNGLALMIHDREIKAIRGLGLADETSGAEIKSITSASGGVVTLGVLCALRHGRWAAWPGLPVPASWLLAPILVSDLSAFSSYSSQLSSFRDSIVARSSERQSTPMEATGDSSSSEPQPSGFELAVALAACEVVESRVRAQYRAPPDDIVEWREHLEHVAEVEAEHAPPSPPDGAILSDVAGLFIALVLGLAMRFRGVRA